jgi:hypothetical protein
LVEDLEKNHADLPQVTDKLYQIMVYTSPWAGVEPTTSVVIGTDCIGSCKSNYRTITATTARFDSNVFTFYDYIVNVFLINKVCVSISPGAHLE